MFSIQLGQVRHRVKQQIKAGVPERERILLKIPHKEEFAGNGVFVRRHEGEFRYKGEMYDVLTAEDHGDTTWYWCIHDVHESGLFKDLNSRIDQYLRTHPRQQKNRELVLGLLHLQYLHSSDRFDLNRPHKATESHRFFDMTLLERNSPPDSPPPDLGYFNIS